MNAQIEIKQPSYCSSDELRKFKSLVLQGGEVTPVGLDRRVEMAERLLFLKTTSCVGIGAVKNPNIQYKSDIFKKSGSEHDPNTIQFELGWFYIEETSRGNGFSNLLLAEAISFVQESGCFATTRESNNIMHKQLNNLGFEQSGSSYKSSKGNYNLVLYIYST